MMLDDDRWLELFVIAEMIGKIHSASFCVCVVLFFGVEETGVHQFDIQSAWTLSCLGYNISYDSMLLMYCLSSA